MESLCIEKGKSAFTLRLDVVFLSLDGAAHEVALAATLAALADCRLPRPVSNEEGAIVLDRGEPPSQTSTVCR